MYAVHATMPAICQHQALLLRSPDSSVTIAPKCFAVLQALLLPRAGTLAELQP